MTKLFNRLPTVLILRITAALILIISLIGGVFWDYPAETFITWGIAFVLSMLFVGVAECIDIAAKSSAKSDPFAEFEKLAGLREKGYITDDEYQSKKQELLSRI